MVTSPVLAGRTVDVRSGEFDGYVRSLIPSLLRRLGCEDDRLCGDLRREVSSVRLRPGEVLYTAGSPADAAYLIVSGRLEVTEISSEGTARTARHLRRGEIIGEDGLLQKGCRERTVRADCDTLLARLPQEAFSRVATDHPSFLFAATRAMIIRAASPDDRVASVSTVAVAVAVEGVNTRAFASRLLHTIQRNHDATLLTSAEPAQSLRNVPSRLPAVAAAAMFDAAESANRFVVLEADRSAARWSSIALRRADRTVIVVPPKPTPEEHRIALGFAEMARAAHRPEIWLAVLRERDDPEPRGTSTLLRRYGADRAVHLRRGNAFDTARLARLATGTGVGLVLGGGGARGFAHLGALRALQENGVPVDVVAGSSIGGILGAAIAAGTPFDQLMRQVVNGFSDVLDYTVPLTSLVSGRKITNAIDNVFSGVEIEDLALPFLCVTTNLTTSELVVHDSGPVTRWTRAGLSIPGVIPPVPHNGHLHVDGGVLDNLPIKPLRETGLVQTVVAVDLSSPAGPKAREDFGLSVSGWRSLLRLLGRRRRSQPAIGDVLMRSMIVASTKHRDELLREGQADLLLRSSLRGVSLLKFDQVESVAEAGYRSVAEQVALWSRTLVTAQHPRPTSSDSTADRRTERSRDVSPHRS